MTRLVYLRVNQAWVFMFGEDLVRLDGEPLFHASYSNAKRAATRKGLNVTRDGFVTVSKPEE